MRTVEDMQELEDIVKQALLTLHGQLNDWERNFCEDMHGKFEVYHASTFVSDKQEEAIRKIQQKYNMG